MFSTILEKTLEKIDSSPYLDNQSHESVCSAFKHRLDLFGDSILFFPHPFTPVSLTGKRCSLSCKHCASHYLEHMVDASSGSERLNDTALALARRGAKGILLSGGSEPDGSVPTYKYRDTIACIKKKTCLKISAHTGIINENQAQELRDFGLDMALVDVIGSNDTIKEILGIDATVRDYENTLKYLSEARIKLAPHIITGLHGGGLSGELTALKMVKKYHPDVLVIVVFIPTENTPLGNVPAPRIEDVVTVITTARLMFDIPVSLSCVRPGGRYRSELDEHAILSGIDRIAVPSRRAYEVSKGIGLKINELDGMCCSY